MERKKVTRTFEMTFESSERLLMRKTARTVWQWCFVCNRQARFAPVLEVGRNLEVSQREIYRSLEGGALGFTELTEGLLLICLECASRKLTQF